MLEELHISNIAIIEDTTITFPSSYVALIGETGAGKSLIVNSLSFLLGERIDFSLIRDKTKKALISACFKLDDEFIKKNTELKEYVNEDNTIILKRTFFSDKTTRNYINEEIVTLNELKRISKHLIDIHSQNDRNALLDVNNQLTYLDYYASKELQPVKEKFTNSYLILNKLKKDYQDLLKENKELDRDYLEYQIKEIEKYNLEEDEIEQLNKEYESLKNYAKLEEKYNSFNTIINSSSISFSDYILLVSKASKALFDTQLNDEAQALYDSLNSVNNNLYLLSDAFSSLDINPNRIDEINSRLYELKNLQRKYGKTTKEILDKLNDYKEKLNNINNFESKVNELNNLVIKQENQTLKLASNLSEIRKKYALKLQKEISNEIAQLGLRKDSFTIEFTQVDLNSSGIDKVEYYVQLNAGIEKNKLIKAASGGENSRLMLAIKCVLNKLDPYNVLVLDEIDTGIDGLQAKLVADKIKKLSNYSQIIVISHLPQVVVSSLNAIYVSKKTINNQTYTTVKELSEEELIYNVAKMLSLDKVSDSALTHSKELRKEYKDEKEKNNCSY